MNVPKYLIVHHTGGTDAAPMADSSGFTFAQCDVLHKERFDMKSSLGYYVGYHYYIEKDGKLYQARADTDEGAHAKGYNLKSLGICMAGNFDATDPTPAQITTLTALLTRLSALYKIEPNFIVPHRQFAQKTCFGTRLPDDWARKLVSGETPVMSREERIAKASALLMEAAALLKGL